MSHTTGQTKEDNQQSNSNSQQAKSDLHQPEPDNLNSSHKLSDADYEFLFNQLLEGIAHGWHEQRILKFFQQLDERGKSAAWIDWLNRIGVELSKLPIQSKRQLGTMMIRLGELTQSSREVNQIGAVSHRIGSELLFGNETTVVWEYVGPDLTSEAARAEVKTEQELAQRLPADFAALGSIESLDSGAVTESNDFATEKANTSEPANYFSSEVITQDSDDEIAIVSEIAVDDRSPVENNVDNLSDKSLAAEPDLPSSWSDSVNSTEVNYGEDFEFELPNKLLDDAEVKSHDLLKANSLEMEPKIAQPITKPEHFADNKSETELSNAIDALDDDVISEPWSLEESNNSSTITVEQVMHLIQSDAELAQQISQKLNVAPLQAKRDITQTENPLSNTNKLDESSLELVESWFNLGLKHVSAGEFEKAIADWEKALKINPNLSEAWHNRGSALGRLGNYEAAVESFQNALRINPNNYQAWNDRAHALYQLQHWLEAVDSWSNAIKITPGNHLFWYNRGCALEQLERWQDAIASYEKALEIKPDFQPGRSRYINLVADNSRAN